MNYPVCDRFFKTIYEGEVCYAIDIADVLKKVNSNTLPGKGNGLILALDMGMNIGKIVGKKRKRKFKDNTFLGQENEDPRASFKMNIGLIGTGSDSRPGKYKMSVPKKKMVTDSFSTLTENDKECQVCIFTLPLFNTLFLGSLSNTTLCFYRPGG